MEKSGSNAIYLNINMRHGTDENWITEPGDAPRNRFKESMDSDLVM